MFSYLYWTICSFWFCKLLLWVLAGGIVHSFMCWLTLELFMQISCQGLASTVKWSASICVALIPPFLCLRIDQVNVPGDTVGHMLNSPFAVNRSTEGPIRLRPTVGLQCPSWDAWSVSITEHILSSVAWDGGTNSDAHVSGSNTGLWLCQDTQLWNRSITFFRRQRARVHQPSRWPSTFQQIGGFCCDPLAITSGFSLVFS